MKSAFDEWEPLTNKKKFINCLLSPQIKSGFVSPKNMWGGGSIMIYVGILFYLVHNILYPTWPCVYMNSVNLSVFINRITTQEIFMHISSGITCLHMQMILSNTTNVRHTTNSLFYLTLKRLPKTSWIPKQTPRLPVDTLDKAYISRQR